jgi:endo-1,4-beta-D-glucanase Y
MGAGAATAGTPFVWYPEPQLKYPHRTLAWEDGLITHYEAWKARFVDANGLVLGSDPSGKKRAISEGQSYGMLLSLWFNDQAMFDKIWKATETGFWRSGKGVGGWYAWLNSGDDNFAGDADQDIAGALICASALVDAKHWNNTTSPSTYNAKAQIVLKSVWNNLVNKSDYQIESWPNAGTGIRNPSYHMPQWYTVFTEFAKANGLTGMDWDKVRAASYALMKAQPNSSKGMARNFSTATGGSPSGGTSALVGSNNRDMGFDAIRVPYRMGMDAMWTRNPEAVKWCKSVWTAGAVDPAMPGMYGVDAANLLGWGTAPKFTDAAYEKPMTNTMWGTSAVAVADSSTAAADAFQTMAVYVQNNGGLNSRNYFGNYDVSDSSEAVNPPNKNYYAQTLGLLGAVAMAGRAPNVWDDLKNIWVVPDTSAKLTSFTASKMSGTYGADSITFTFKFSKAATCTLNIVGDKSKARNYTILKGSTGSTVKWKMGVATGVAATKFLGETGETVTATMKWAGMPATTSNNVIANIQMVGTVGIRDQAGSKATLQRQADGSMLVRQPWFSEASPVRLRLRNAAGLVLRTSESMPEANGSVRLSAQSLAPGWYSLEMESNGERATQSFSLTR